MTADGLAPVVSPVGPTRLSVPSPGEAFRKVMTPLGPLEPRFATTTSSCGSLVTLAIVTEFGFVAVVKFAGAAKLGGLPLGVVLSSTERPFAPAVPLLTTARSGFPSPLRSPIATSTGVGPVVKLVGAVNAGVDAPRGVTLTSTETPSAVTWFAMARSGRPSPVRSPDATPAGKPPVAKVPAGANEGDAPAGGAALKA